MIGQHQTKVIKKNFQIELTHAIKDLEIIADYHKYLGMWLTIGNNNKKHTEPQSTIYTVVGLLHVQHLVNKGKQLSILTLRKVREFGAVIIQCCSKKWDT